MRHLILAFAILIPLAGRAEARSELACAASPLHLQSYGKCDTSKADDSSGTTVYRNWGEMPGGVYALTLSQAVPPARVVIGAMDGVERRLKNFSPEVKQLGTNWSAFADRDGIHYATFDLANARCIGFLQPGPKVDGGHQWAITGYECLVRGIDFDELTRMLAATRVGAAAGAHGAANALGQPIEAATVYRARR